MKIIPLMKHCALFLFCAIICQLEAQSTDNWTWYDDPALFGTYTNALDQDPDGNLWIGANGKLIRFDGTNWLPLSVEDSGLPTINATPTSIDASLGTTIWAGTSSKVVAYDLTTQQWTVHDPFNSNNNFNGKQLRVESPDRIWWATGNGLREYNGTEWQHHHFYQPGLDQVTYSLRKIEIDHDNQKWMTTPSSICIEGGCYTPAGLVRLNDTDTTFFDGASFGFPYAARTLIKIKSNGEPILVINQWITKNNYYLTYTDGQWSSPVSIPYEGHVLHIGLGNEDQLYVVFDEFIAVEEDGIWDVIALDPNQISQISDFLVTPDNGIYVSGRRGNSTTGFEGVIGYLPELRYRLRGSVYSDFNFNGLLESSDRALRHHPVLNVEQDRLTFSNLVGDYSFIFAEAGGYTVEGLLPAYHSYGIPSNGTHTVNLSVNDPVQNGQHIGFEPDLSATDLSVALTPLNNPNPGFAVCYILNIQNQAPRLTEGEVTIAIDPLLTLVSSSDTPTAINDHQYSFAVAGLQWLEMRSIQLCFLLPPDPNLVGHTLKHYATVMPTGGVDLQTTDNADTLCHVVTGPYDPNYIAVRPAGEGAEGDIPVTTPLLEYTIHFQNIGTDTARHVVIDNPIDAHLDLRSLRVIGASHPYDFTYEVEENLLKWSFADINLPDSTASPLASNGFIKYTLDFASREIGTTFRNQAHIFFDFNAPITTNTTLNTFKNTPVNVANLPLVEECAYRLQVIDEQLHLYFPALEEYKIGLYDMQGRHLSTTLAHHTEVRLPLEHLPRGTYVVRAETAGCRGTGKTFLKH